MASNDFVRIRRSESAADPAIRAFCERCRPSAKLMLDSFVGEGIYLRDRYVQRLEFSKEFESYLQSARPLFALIGASGVGKTNAMCKAAETLLGEHLPVVIPARALDRASNPSELLEQAVRAVLPDLASVQRAVLAKALLDEQVGDRVVIFLDGINEYRRGSVFELFAALQDLAALLRQESKLRLCFSCRDHVWELIRRSTNVNDALMREHVMPEFTEGEARQAFTLYRCVTGRVDDYDSLSDYTREACRDPFILRMVDEAYPESAVPADAPSQEVFERYIAAKKRDLEGAEELLSFLVCAMNNACSDQVDLDEALRTADMSHPSRFDDVLYLRPSRLPLTAPGTPLDMQPYHRLRSAGVLQEVPVPGAPPGSVAVRMHDRLFEYLLAKEILAQFGNVSAGHIQKLVSWRARFQSYWGVARYLMLASPPSLFPELLRTDDLDAHALMVEVLGSLVAQRGQEESRRTVDFVFSLRDERLTACLARAAPRLGPLAATVFTRLLLDPLKPSIAVLVYCI